jgi:hypothetical protein
MKFRAVYILAILWFMTAMPAFAWNFAAWDFAKPHSTQPAYQEPAIFSLANQANHQNTATFSAVNQENHQNTATSSAVNQETNSSFWLNLMMVSHKHVGSTKAEIASDVPFVFSDNLTSIAGYSSDEIKKISASSTDLNGIPMNSSPDKWDLQEEFNARIEPDNPIVRQEVVMLNAIYHGKPEISQICSIFEY